MVKHCTKCGASSQIDVKIKTLFASGREVTTHKVVCYKCKHTKKFKHSVKWVKVK